MTAPVGPALARTRAYLSGLAASLDAPAGGSGRQIRPS